MEKPQFWYGLDPDAALAALQSSPAGLTPAEAAERLRRYGPNELEEKRRAGPIAIFFSQFKSVLIVILLVGVAISAAVGETIDSLVILAVILASATMGFIQEYRSEKALAALKKMTAPTATVVRGGQETEVPAEQIVPGDVISITTGDRVPADGRLLESVNLQVDESVLTGESVPVAKTTAALPARECPVGDRKNMVFTGTSAAYGRGKAVVVATGMKTEFGRIAAMLQEVKTEKTPLQHSLDRVGKALGIGALGIVAVIAALGIARDHPLLEMLIWGISLAVAAVPESLPAVVTITLALGVQRLAKVHALVRRLPAVETLGCTTYICSDKTGTLTRNEMTVRRLWAGGRQVEVTGAGYEPEGQLLADGRVVAPGEDKAIHALVLAGVLCNDSHLMRQPEGWRTTGDPTEGALVVLAAKAGVSQEDMVSRHPRVNEVPFSSERKMMSTVHSDDGKAVVYSKGAPEVILGRCRYIIRDGEERELTQQDRDEAALAANRFAQDALRVLAAAYRRLPSVPGDVQDIERDMVFAGLVGMIDPPREEAREAIGKCRRAGIKPVMITGDHKVTAEAIARELKILGTGLSLTGGELDAMDGAKLAEVVEGVEVYSRVSPEHKLRIVDALTAKGHVVAMTGDGVNDAPALKKAGIGIAMGITGTDVTKEAAAVVLTDDNFASIVAAVEEGRGIFENIKKFILYMLSANGGEIVIMLIAGLLALPLPVAAIHLLWINLVTDGLPALAIAVDPAEPDLMDRPPRDPRASIFTAHMLRLIGLLSLLLATVAVPLFVFTLSSGAPLEKAQTMVFTTIAVFELFVVFALRSERFTLMEMGLLSNRWLVYATLSSFVLMLLVIYVPFLQRPFRVVPLGLADWALIVPLSLTGFAAVEAYKLLRRRRSR